MALKEMSRFTKYLMVVTMLSITFGLLFWLCKRIMHMREEYQKQVELANQKRHAKVAIMEEQEDNKIKEETDNNLDMKNDGKHYSQYLDFSPVALWDRFSITKDVVRYNDKCGVINEMTPANIEILLYYQSFVKLFRIIVLKVGNLEYFQTNDSYMLRVKILISRSNGSNISEASQLYRMKGSVTVDERFEFRMEEHDFTGCILYVTVWNMDVFYKELLLGAISIDLGMYDHSLKKTLVAEILPVKQDTNVYGYLLISLCHIPSAERLVCVVMSGRGLKEDIKQTSVLSKAMNPYLKVSLLNDGKLIKRHKTAITLETRDPVFNEMIEFYIPFNQIVAADILIVVSYRDDKNFNETIGKLLVGNHCTGSCYDHWIETMNNPEQSFARWHAVSR